MESNKKNFLAITTTQFGYHMGLYFHSKYLLETHNVSVVSWDLGLEKKFINGVNVIYINREGNRFKRFSRFIKSVLIEYRRNDIIYFMYFNFCSIVKLFLTIFSRKNNIIILDIRSGCVSNKKKTRLLNDILLKYEAKLFKNITIISKGLRDALLINPKKCHILPLGAEISESKIKDNKIDEMKLLYVGRFYTRNIEDTIEGISLFVKEYGDKISITYDIIGFGNGEEEKIINDVIKKHSLDNIVYLHGRIYYPELSAYFNKCNIGISYIPLTNYYDYQPPTKTYEYLINGLVVIATSTSENRNIIDVNNGVLIADNSVSFYEGIKKIYLKKNTFNSQKIRKNIENHSWENITKSILIPYLEKL